MAATRSTSEIPRDISAPLWLRRSLQLTGLKGKATDNDTNHVDVPVNIAVSFSQWLTVCDSSCTPHRRGDGHLTDSTHNALRTLAIRLRKDRGVYND